MQIFHFDVLISNSTLFGKWSGNYRKQHIITWAAISVFSERIFYIGEIRVWVCYLLILTWNSNLAHYVNTGHGQVKVFVLKKEIRFLERNPTGVKRS